MSEYIPYCIQLAQMAKLEAEEATHNLVGRYIVFKMSQTQENSWEWPLCKEHKKRKYSAYTEL